jgi:hypothetical protein
MNLPEYRKIVDALNADLAATFAKHGLKMGKLNAAVDSLSGTIRYTIVAADAALKDKDGNAATPEALRYTNYAQMMGMKPEWLNQTFRAGNNEYTLRGLKDGRATKSIIVERGGKMYVMTPFDVTAAFNLKAIRAA